MTHARASAHSPATRTVPAPWLRAWIARRVLGTDDLPVVVGGVELMPHQRDAVARLDMMLREHGGALLADDAGLGKTYVALALAARRGGALVVAPASLRVMWEHAAARAAVPVRIVSVESLGRADTLAGGEPFVIVDEAHHARNRRAKRWRLLAARCATTPVLLLSATPLHNRRGELVSQLALFLGVRAGALGDAGIARHVVRRTRDEIRLDRPLPALSGPHWVPLPEADEALLDAIVALPPPLPPADGGTAGALVQWTLVRQWSSSRAALAGALRRRLGQAIAMRESLERGVLPSRRDLAAWECAEGTLQLALPELLATPGAHADAAEWLGAVRAHESAVAELLECVRRDPDPDCLRAAAVARIAAGHRGERVIAFAERAETVERLWELLRHLPGTAMLTAQGGRVAGGPIPRRELLARLARPPRDASDAERVSLLLATDLLSEGVNLQEASVVVHLDLPWSPARMEQRVGRVRRFGSPHLLVTAYALRPPASAERLLRVERRLREKLAAAGRAIGVAGSIVPGPVAVAPPSPPESWSGVLARLAAWRDAVGARDPVDHGPAASPSHDGAPLVARAWGSRALAIALVEPAAHGAASSQRPRLLVVDARGRIAEDPASLAEALALAAGADAPASDTDVERFLDITRRAIARGRIAGMIGGGGGDPGDHRPSAFASAHALHRALVARVDRSVALAPRHERAALLPLAAIARRAVLAGASAGVERVLAELLASPLAPGAWLRALAAFVAAAERARRPVHDGTIAGRPRDDEERLVALLVVRPLATAPSGPG